MRYAIVLLHLLFSCGLLSAAQAFQPEIINPLTESWRWRHFPELEGKGVSSIVEDQNGVVWFGVNDGVVEYDGYAWKWHQEKDGLPASPVEQVYAAKNGNIYAGTAAGLYVYKGSRWEKVFSTAGLHIGYRQIRELSNGSLMLSSHIGMFEIQADGALRVITSAHNKEALASHLPQASWLVLPKSILGEENFLDISDMIEVSPSQVWMSITLSNISRVIAFDLADLSDRELDNYTVIEPGKTSPGFGETQKFLRAQDGSIWMINTSTHVGLHRYNQGRWDYIELSDRFGGDEYTTDIIQTTDGTIWIGMLGKLLTWKNEQWEQYKSPEFKIPASRLLLTESRLRHIWIGGYRSKIFRLDYSSSRWESYRNLNFQCDTRSGVRYFLDVHGRVIRQTEDTWLAYDAEDGLMNAPVKVLVSSKGTVWAAGSHNGVAATAYLDGDHWVTETHPNLSWGIDYRAVFEASDGSIWFGGSVDFFREKGQFGGVLQLKHPGTANQEWVYHRYNQNGLTQSNAYGVAQSPDGRIWIGGGNLFYYDGQQWGRPEQHDLRQYINIVSSTPGMLVAGSRFYGIFIYDGKTWQKFDTESGLSSNTIISLYADGPGSIWAATENDISHFDGQGWVNQVFPPEMTMSHEGGHLARSQDGAIWINKSSREWKRRAFTYNKISTEMSDGFVTYRYLPDNNHPETSVDLFSEEVSAQGNMLVSWSGEDYFGDTPDERLLFSYRLNGGEWSPYTSATHHSFMDLRSGQYTLEVRARDMDFNVDPTPVVIRFLVHPPVWQQSWFIGLMLVFLLTIGIFEYRIITKKQKLERLNVSLNRINAQLQEKNSQVLTQQQQILLQKKALEQSNQNLECQNLEIQHQRDQLEEMVAQVEALSRSKINFFTNISHELRTPLTLILGPVSQLRRSGPGSQTPLLDIIERNASRLLILINQLLEMRRIEENTLELDPSKGNLAQFLEEIMQLFQELAREKHIHLSFDNQCHNALAVFDADKVEKIVANLLSNAFKHTPEGGKIAISLREDNATRIEGKAFVLSVADTGQGIAPRKLERIFERYYSSGQQDHSSGIGLSYIKDLVNLHQGQIDVWSEEGKGTTFQVTLPALLESVERPADLPAPAHLSGWDVRQLSVPQNRKQHGTAATDNEQTPRLLLVEDNPDMLDFLGNLLGSKYRILKAINGREGLQIARNHPVDLILSDVMMPEMDGLEFCNQLKSDLNTSHIPVVLLTAKGLEEHLMDGYETGADDYIVKPFNPELLEIRIENLLSQRRQLWDKFNREFALTPKAVKLTSPDEELLHRIVEIMEEHIMDAEFNVNKMCEMVNLSHMHFIRKVKQLTGKKPVELLKTYRLKRAKDLLQQNKANISEVAYMVGYDLPNSFSRAFKKIYGLSPSEYVESLARGETRSFAQSPYQP
ncbi:MAG: response regulator [Saprospiraceae bacterium]|nr:response regulator [Saprospiraceae bacterium]